MSYRGQRKSSYGKSKHSSKSGNKRRKAESWSEKIGRLQQQKAFENRDPSIMTVKEAIKNHYGNYVFNFQGEKWFRFPDWSNEIYKTDHYGHFEVELESFLAAEAGVDEDTLFANAVDMIRNYLLKHEVSEE